MTVEFQMIPIDDFTTIVDADCAVLTSNSWGFWITAEQELLAARNLAFHQSFMAQVDAWNAQNPGATPPVISVTIDGKMSGQGFERAVFGIDDNPKESLIRQLERALGVANGNLMETVVIPLYQGGDTDFEYQSRASQLKIVLLSYLEVTEYMQHIQRVIIAVGDDRSRALAIGMMPELFQGIKHRRRSVLG